VGFCFNRKEAKDHGEGGSLVGAELKRGVRVLIIEDVTTAGTSIRETVPILKAHADINVVGLVVSVDRKERTSDDASAGPAPSALAQLRDEFAFDHAFAIVDIDQVMEHLRDQQSGGDQVMDDKTQEAMLAYRKRYGASA
jgi:orotate phosphoribosyltransferase